ncbi:MAG: hypothetical protein JXR83_19365, partial [Deltaproteobacteria bacterium]|nr:hypothetical protein [Deltaproteobacteria bacterium]
TRSLLPGQLERLSHSWPLPVDLIWTPLVIRVQADDVGDGTGEHNECEDGGEDNNAAALDDVVCGDAG